MELKKDTPALIILLATILLAMGYSAYKSINQYNEKKFDICPLCNERVTIKI